MKKNDTRLHILDAASDLFWRSSYHAVNMNELSRMAGLNKATVYQYFTSKEDLAAAALERAAQQIEDCVYKPAFAETVDPKDRIRRIFQNVHQMHTDIFQSDGKCRGCAFVNIGVEMSSTSDAVRRAVNQALACFGSYFGEIVDDLVHSGELAPSIDRAETVSALMSVMNGCLVTSKLENRSDAILDGQKHALRLLGF